jgi:Mn-dependent DtxR family transcriptional regulator
MQYNTGGERRMEDQLKVLKVMNEVTSRMDLNAFAQMVGLNPNQTIEHVKELVNAGLVRKMGAGYGITEKGKVILKAITPVPKDMAFHFYTDVGHPTGFSAESLKEFYEIIKRVTVESVEFHLYRGDFENWINAAFKDAALAGKLASLKNSGLKGEELKKEIVAAIAAAYSL